MNVVELYDRIENREPTIMDAEREMFYFEQLMSLPFKEIIDHPRDFNNILVRLDMSHTDTYLLVDDNNIGKFVEFADWLSALGKQIGYSDEESANLAEFANTFRVDPRKVFGKKDD